jgi:hypothetical protein
MALITRRRLWRRRRLALGLTPMPGPGLTVMIVGIIIGPGGLGLLSTATSDALDPLVSLALASLGVFIGLELRLRGRREKLLLVAGSLEGSITIAAVAAGCLLTARIAPDLFLDVGVAAALLGICAAPSSTVADHGEAPEHTRIGDFDDILPIVIAGLAAVWVRSGQPSAFVWLFVQTASMATLLAAAAMLLVRQTGTEGEQRVFSIGAVLLLGGIAAHLSLSALALGTFAGLCWNVMGGEGRDRIMRDLRYLQHPLTMALLVLAGARLHYGPALTLLLLLYLALRTAGKLLGSYISQRVAFGIRTPTLSGRHLTSPGVVGIAIALEALRIDADPATSVIFSVVVAGTLVLDLLSLVIAREDESA